MDLLQLGFERKPEWDYKVSKKRTREVYVKHYGIFSVKAFKLHNGISFGKLIDNESPLCSKYGNANSIKEFNEKIESWI